MYASECQAIASSDEQFSSLEQIISIALPLKKQFCVRCIVRRLK
ncbi:MULTISPECIES: hypothetical protein [Nostoc]|nr:MULTISPECIES: hypothetical protein [Nostoc]